MHSFKAPVPYGYDLLIGLPSPGVMVLFLEHPDIRMVNTRHTFRHFFHQKPPMESVSSTGKKSVDNTAAGL